MYFSDLKRAFILLLPSRLLMLFLIFIVAGTTFTREKRPEGIVYRAENTLNLESTFHNMQRVWQSADARWYLEISQHGYSDEQDLTSRKQNWVFFPLYPMLMKYVGDILGSYLLAGMIISNTCLIFAFALLYRLGPKLGFDEKATTRALWLLSFFPTSYFLSSCLTESLFLVLVSGAWLSLKNYKSLQGGLCMALASACRPTGLLMLPAFACLLWSESAPKRRLTTLLALLISPLGSVVYALYLWRHVGSPLAFVINQKAWGRNKSSFAELLSLPFVDQWQLVASWNFILLNTLIALLGIVCALYLLHRKQVALALLVAVPLLASLNTGTVLSIGRFSLTLFPLFLVLGRLAESAYLEKLLLVTFSVLFALMVVGYALHVTAAMA